MQRGGGENTFKTNKNEISIILFIYCVIYSKQIMSKILDFQDFHFFNSLCGQWPDFVPSLCMQEHMKCFQNSQLPLKNYINLDINNWYWKVYNSSVKNTKIIWQLTRLQKVNSPWTKWHMAKHTQNIIYW